MSHWPLWLHPVRRYNPDKLKILILLAEVRRMFGNGGHVTSSLYFIMNYFGALCGNKIVMGYFRNLQVIEDCRFQPSETVDYYVWSNFIALETMAEALMPYFLSTRDPGAEAPKRLIPMTAPLLPT